MTEATTPIVVNPSAVPVVAGTLGRDALVVLTALPILIKLIGARDLTGVLQYLQSSDGATLVSIVVPAVVLWWRSRRSVKEQAKLVTVAREVSDDVAVVTGATPPPSVVQ
jgi:hypothetical protein